MNNLDLFIIIPIIYGAYKGYRRGIIVEGVSILAFVVSVMIGFKFLNESMGLLSPYLSNPVTQRLLPYIGFAVLFFPIVFLINKLGWLLRSSTKATILGNFDSLLGATFGAFTWTFGLSVIFWIITSIGIKISAVQVEKSIIYPIIKPIAPKIIGIATDFVKKNDAKEVFEKIKNTDL